MPIAGLRRNEQGAESLARAGVIRLGYKAHKCKGCGEIVKAAIPKCPKCKKSDFGADFPKEADHFVLDSAPDIIQALGTDHLSELKIYFPFDEVESNFPQFMQYFTASSLVCKGDGEKIIHAINPTTGRRVVRNGIALVDFMDEGKIQVAAGQYMACPGLDRDLYPKCSKCKPSGMLLVFLRDIPRLAYYQIPTNSIHNLVNLSEQLYYVQKEVEKLTGHPRLAGIPFILKRVRRSLSVPKTDNKGNQVGRQRVEKWLLELEIEFDWVQKMTWAQARLTDPMGGVAALSAPAEAVDNGDDDELFIIEGQSPVETVPEPEPKLTDLSKFDFFNKVKADLDVSPQVAGYICQISGLVNGKYNQAKAEEMWEIISTIGLDMQHFVATVIDTIPFYTSDKQVIAAIKAAEMVYDAENEEAIFDALAQAASAKADEAADGIEQATFAE